MFKPSFCAINFISLSCESIDIICRSSDSLDLRAYRQYLSSGALVSIAGGRIPRIKRKSSYLASAMAALEQSELPDAVNGVHGIYETQIY